MLKARQILSLPHVRILGLAVGLLLAGCGDSAQPQSSENNGTKIPDGVEDAGAIVCKDYDNDGFGPGCAKGLDCNDKDPAITNECYKCNQNAQGCPCSQEGQSITCGDLAPDSSGCIHGKRVCSGGSWTACVSDGSGPKPLPPGWAPTGLGGSTTACQNTPCDPYCQHYPDVPDPTLTNDAGILGKDSGLQLQPKPVDAGPSATCVNETATATPIPLDIFIMLDRSGSMSGSRWDSVEAAIGSFVDSSSAAGIGVGLGLFSYPDSTSCDVATYATPRVPIATLPGNAALIKSTIAATSPTTNTPTTPALEGSLQYAKTYALAHPTHKVVVVLATDGEPNSCSPTCTIANVSSTAATGFAGTPSIPTYVIGVGPNTGNLTTIAVGGGTGSPYMVTSGSSTSFLAAMQDIRASALGCDYTLPTPSTGNLDPNATTVNFQLGTGATTAVPVATNAGACSGNGFYYDDPANPTKLTLCPATCTTVKSNTNYKVNLTFACKANCGSSSAAVTPIPLDMYVMLDKSGSMGGTSWTSVTGALKSFVDATGSSGIGVGLDYFPLPESGSSECLVSQYSTPSVGIADLPGNAAAIKTSLNATNPNAGTPTEPALQGAINYTRSWATANPTHKVVVVLATDGEPNDCSSDIPGVAAIAAAGFAGGATGATYSAAVVGTDPVIKLAGTGKATNITGDDNTGGPYTISFPVKFYGVDYTTFWVSTNGIISLGQSPTNSWSNIGIPNTATPNAMLAPFWDDLQVDGNIYYDEQGTSPNRALIVQWTGTHRHASTGNLSFEIVLYENGTISYRYGALSGADGVLSTRASDATIGFENPAGNLGVQYSLNTATINANTSVTWNVVSSTTYSAAAVGTDPFLDATGAPIGTAVATNVTGDDNRGGPYTISFPVKYYGQDYTKFYVSTNGIISLGQDCGTGFTNVSIPTASAPDGMLAPYWDDLQVDGNIYYDQQGTSPNRMLIVQWVGTHRRSQTGDLSIEIVLSENGTISYRYGPLSGSDGTVSSRASSATIGFEDSTGSAGVQYSLNTATINPNTSVKWTMTTSTSTYPSIPTYVIGIGSSTGNLTTIASAGGTGSPFMVTGGSSAQFLAAMQSIRQSALGCGYNIPPTTLGIPDPENLSVRYNVNGVGAPQIIPKVSGAGACGSNPGYFFDDPLNPTILTLCPATCTAVSADMNAKLNIFYDCKPSYPDGTFTRDYSSDGICPPGSSPVWGIWQWTANTPSNSHIDFTVAVASTAAGLNSATQQDLLYSDQPVALVGQPVVAATPNSNGATSVDKTLSVKVMDRKAPFLRIRAKLVAETPYKVQTPYLTSWDLGISCEASE